MKKFQLFCLLLCSLISMVHGSSNNRKTRKERKALISTMKDSDSNQGNLLTKAVELNNQEIQQVLKFQKSLTLSVINETLSPELISSLDCLKRDIVYAIRLNTEMSNVVNPTSPLGVQKLLKVGKRFADTIEGVKHTQQTIYNNVVENLIIINRGSTRLEAQQMLDTIKGDLKFTAKYDDLG